MIETNKKNKKHDAGESSQGSNTKETFESIYRMIRTFCAEVYCLKLIR